MKSKTNILFLLAGLLSVVLSVKTGRAFFDIQKIENENTAKVSPRFYVPDHWQKKVGDVASATGVRTLNALNLTGSDRDPGINLSWDASLGATQAFLSALQSEGLVGPALRLQLTPSLLSGQVLAKASFQAPRSHESQSKPKIVSIPIRNVFASPARSVLAPTAALPRPPAGPSREDRERMEKYRRNHEELARLENKKREVESTLVLTGIVNNGIDAMAVVDARGNQRRTWMLKTGDVVNGVRVISIDQNRGEVALDFEGKIQFFLRLNSGGVPIQ